MINPGNRCDACHDPSVDIFLVLVGVGVFKLCSTCHEHYEKCNNIVADYMDLRVYLQVVGNKITVERV